MKCTICGDEFEGRADAKFCSASCRKKASRNKTPENNIPTRVEAVHKKTDKIIPEPVMDRNLMREEDIPKEEWFDPFTPVEPIIDVYQPVNGDAMCDGELLKGVYPKGQGNELLARRYTQHENYHQKSCNPVQESRAALSK